MEKISISRKTTTRALWIAISLSSALFAISIFTPIAHANILDRVKDFLSSEEKNISIDSSISLAENGDLNNNQQIDSGDIVRFSYEIKNTTGKKYIYTTLKTNLTRNDINFIHNIYGVTGINDSEDTIIFPNIRIEDQEILNISFDARINYFEDQDKILSTEPELISSNKDSIAKGLRRESRVKHLSKEQINKENNGITNTKKSK